MTDYTPTDEDLYEQIAKSRYEYDYTSPWEHLAPTPRKLLTQAARNTMEPILARVKRDSAREALDGLAEWHDREAANSGPGSHYWDASSHVATSARHHRDTHYTETEG